MNKPKLIVLTGPTATGKTALSIEIAEKLTTKTGKLVEIISADSRQIYKHIPITTAQPHKNELKKFKHHFINELELEEEFNAGLFGRDARKLIREILNNNKLILIVGGSGLYINSLIYGFFELKINDDDLKYKISYYRKQLYKIKDEKGLDYLISKLKEIDNEYIYSLREITDRRIIRALEIYYATGIPFSVHRKNKIPIDFEAVIYAISVNRNELYEKINKRTDKMIKEGIVEEIELLHNRGYHYTTHNSLNTVGAKEIFDYIGGKINKQKMIELIKQNTRRFAKRQLTWFKADKNIKWVENIKEINIDIYL